MDGLDSVNRSAAAFAGAQYQWHFPGQTVQQTIPILVVSENEDQVPTI